MPRCEHLALMVETGTHFLMGSDTAEEVGEVNLTDELIDAVADGCLQHRHEARHSLVGNVSGMPSWQDGAPPTRGVFRNPKPTSAPFAPSGVLLTACASMNTGSNGLADLIVVEI